MWLFIVECIECILPDRVFTCFTQHLGFSAAGERPEAACVHGVDLGKTARHMVLVGGTHSSERRFSGN